MNEEQKSYLDTIMQHAVSYAGQGESYGEDATIHQSYLMGLMVLELSRIANALEALASDGLRVTNTRQE